MTDLTLCIQVFSSSTAMSHDQSSPPETAGKRHSWGRVLGAGQGLWAGQPGTGRSWVRIFCLVGTGLLLLLFRIHLLQVGKRRSKKKFFGRLATCHSFQFCFYSIYLHYLRGGLRLMRLETGLQVEMLRVFLVKGQIQWRNGPVFLQRDSNPVSECRPA
jgi:hypothetical protein